MSGTKCSICGNTRAGELAGVDDAFGTVCADRRACNVREHFSRLGTGMAAFTRGVQALAEVIKSAAGSVASLADTHQRESR